MSNGRLSLLQETNRPVEKHQNIPFHQINTFEQVLN